MQKESFLILLMQFSALRLARRSFVVAFAASCGIGSLGGAAWAGEVSQNAPETVAPVEFGVRTPAKPLDSLTFVAPSKSELVGAVGFNLNNVARDVALEQIKAGTLTPEAAWQSGALTFDNIADLLEKEPDVYVINYREGSDGLHQRLLALLLQHEGARLQNLNKVSPRLRLWLANYYWLQGDAKTIEVAQSLLDEFPPPAVGPGMIAYQAMERIAWFQRDKGQHQKSGETWLLWKAYQGGPDWAPINVKLEAVRELDAAGPQNAEQVSKLRQELIAQKDGWTTALVYYEEYHALLAAGKPEAARRALGKPIDATTSAAEGRIAQSAWLAQIAYQSGDLDDALRLSKIAVDAGQGVAINSASFRYLYQMARDTQTRAGGWKKNPIQTDTKEILFEINPNEPNQTHYKRVIIKTYGDISINASVDNPAFQARVLPDNIWQYHSLKPSEQKVIVQISLETITLGGKATLLISSPEFPNFQLSVPVLVPKS